MLKKQISPYAQTLLDAWVILLQNKTDKHKIYSHHEPHVNGKPPEILIADRGYKGQKEFGKTRLLTPSVPLKTDSQYD